MTSGASWNERGLSPELYEAAREAARRAGMSVEEWLDFDLRRPDARAPGRPAETPARARGARLTDTVAKLNARLEQLSERTCARREPGRAGRARPRPSDRARARSNPASIRCWRRSPPASARSKRRPPRRPQPGSARARPTRGFRKPRTAAHPHHGADRDVAPAVRRRGFGRGAARRSRRDRARRQRRAAAPRARKPAGRHAGARRAHRARAMAAAPTPSALQGIEHRLSQMHAALNQMTPAEGSCRLRRAHRRAFAQDGRFRRQFARSRRCCAISRPRSTSCASSPPASRRPKASRRSPATCRRSARASITSRWSAARAASIRWRSASTS